MLSILAITAIPAAFAQPPAGADISTAIPVYYGQFVNDIGDVHSNPLQVYSIGLAKGQQFSRPRVHIMSQWPLTLSA